jgi:MFS family permease
VTGTVGAEHPRPGSLALLASIVVSSLAASSALTPLYATYASEWRFSPITTTVVFGAYALAVLLALLVLGRVSDHIGRRPVLVAALAIQVAAMVVLATAGGVAALLAGRALQGLATSGAMGALGAAMLDVDPRRGALANAAAPGMGTGVGSLLSGLLVQYMAAPTHLVYLVLIGVFVLQGVGVVLVRETAARRPGLRTALLPELAVPQGVRGAMLAAAPVLFAVWALAGFYGSLGPALARQLSGSTSAVVGGLGFFLLAVAGSLTTILLNRTPPRTVMPIGIAVHCVGDPASCGHRSGAPPVRPDMAAAPAGPGRRDRRGRFPAPGHRAAAAHLRISSSSTVPAGCKPTIYRYWPNQLAVAIDALVARMAGEVPTADLGDARSDLTEQVRRVTAFYARPAWTGC